MSVTSKISGNKKIAIQITDQISNFTSSRYLSTSRMTPRQYLSKIRASIPPEYYHELLTKLEKLPYSATHLLNSNNKKSIKDLDEEDLFLVDFDTEFYWAKAIILRNQPAINRYIELSENYSKQIISCRIDDARQSLEAIEAEFGYSIWLIKNKIAFLQLTEGLEAQKDYTLQIKSELSDGSLTKFILHWISVRNETKTTLSRFINQVEPILNRLNPITQNGYREFCEYHLLNPDLKDAEELINVLRLEFSSSIIDYYEAFVALLRVMCLDKEEILVSKVSFLLRNKNFVIRDKRLVMLRQVIDNSINPNNSFDHHFEIYNLVLNGQYKEAFKRANVKLNLEPGNAILIMASSFAKAMVPEHDIAVSEIEEFRYDDGVMIDLNVVIVNKLAKVIKKGIVAMISDVGDLKKIALNFSCFEWTIPINIILLKENFGLEKLDTLSALQALKVSQIHPVFLECFESTNILQKYMENCLNNFPGQVINDYYLSLVSGKSKIASNKISESNYLLLDALRSFKNQEYHKAIEFANKLKLVNNQYFDRMAYRIVSHSYYRLNNLAEACKNSCDCFIKHPDYYIILPLIEIFEAVTPVTAEWKSLSASIDLPILLDAYVKHLDKKLETNRRFAYEDFLLNNSIAKPSQLEPIQQKFEHEKLVYYLRYVCIESIMDTSSAFAGGSKEVLEERLAICRLLIKIDSSNEETYKNEINIIVRRQVLADRRQEVDQSRIYIDIERVKEWARKEIKESFNRYQEYLKHGLNQKIDAALKSESKVQTTVTSGIAIPENEVAALFKYMLEEIMEAYLSVEFGLDRFLSTRIRHGILEGHLRKPIQDHFLITQRQSKAGPYLKNEFWLNKLAFVGPDLLKAFDKAFNKFSESYDKLILTISDEWLQVKRENKPTGLFGFKIDEKGSNLLSESIGVNTSLEDFLEQVIRDLDSILVLDLFDVREKLNSIAKTKAKRLLNELQSALFVQGIPQLPELQTHINQSRTDIQLQFDKIREWFVPPTSGNSSPYFIEDPMIVAETIVREINSSFEVEISADASSEIPIHGHLPIFVDIFVNAFENIVKRSGLALPTAKINIWVNDKSDTLKYICCKIINELGEDIDIEKVDSELKRKKALLQKGDYKQYLASEKNSGLFKIHKSVSDFSIADCPEAKGIFDFGIENSTFQVTISIPLRIYLSDEKNEMI